MQSQRLVPMGYLQPDRELFSLLGLTFYGLQDGP